MSTEAKTETKKSGGWLKMILGTFAGMLSGALAMYVPTILDKVVKPAPPVANFAVEHQGLSVTFHNRSAGASQGRWDFGDGSPLEFVKAEQPTITHTYPKPGMYVAKFTVSNILGDVNERPVSIEVTDDTPEPPAKPAIVDLYVRGPGKVGQRVYAPATFQFTATADNAQMYLWDFGDGHGVQAGEEDASHTFAKPGVYTVTLVAFNGKQKSQHEVTIDVDEPPAGTLNVSLSVADQGTQLETRRRDVIASQGLNLSGKNTPGTIEQVLTASASHEIVSVERRDKESQSTNVEKIQWQIAADKKSVKVTAQVVKKGNQANAVLNERFVLTEQRKAKATRDPIPVATTLAAPGSATVRLPPIPDNWTDVKRLYSFELKQDDKVLWRGSQLPQNVPVTLNGQTYMLATTSKGDQLQINLVNRVASN